MLRAHVQSFLQTLNLMCLAVRFPLNTVYQKDGCNLLPLKNISIEIYNKSFKFAKKLYIAFCLSYSI